MDADTRLWYRALLTRHVFFREQCEALLKEVCFHRALLQTSTRSTHMAVLRWLRLVHAEYLDCRQEVARAQSALHSALVRDFPLPGDTSGKHHQTWSLRM